MSSSGPLPFTFSVMFGQKFAEPKRRKMLPVTENYGADVTIGGIFPYVGTENWKGPVADYRWTILSVGWRKPGVKRVDARDVR